VAKSVNKSRFKKLFLPLIIFILFIVGVFLFFNWQNVWVVTQQQYFLLVNRDKKVGNSSIEIKFFDSKSLLGIKKEYKVYLPAAYKDNPDQHFPVLYLLHGYPGTPDDWLINANIQHQLDSLFEQENATPFIVVFPDGNGPIIQDSQYVNATAVKQDMESYLLEVVTQIDQNYRTKPQREYRAIGGVSSGGYAGVNVGLHQNQIFSYFLSISGYFMNREYIIKKLFRGNTGEEHKNNPLEYVNTVTVIDPTYVSLEVGSKDYSIFLKDNQAFDQKLTEQQIPHLLHYYEGSHGWSYWKNNMTTPLQNLESFWQTQIDKEELAHPPSPSPRSFFPFRQRRK
jgi:enterochelin esterase-like enzyme